MSGTTPQQDWLMIPVPQHLAPAVYALIAQEMAPKPAAVQAIETVVSKTAWSEEEIARAINESPATMKAILEAMALNAGEWIGAERLAEALQTRVEHYGGENNPTANWNTVAGTLGAYGHRVKARYGKDEWFSKARKDSGGYWVHLMDPEVAKLVLVLLRGGDGG